MSSPAHAPHRFSPAAFVGMAVPMIVSRAGLAAMGIGDAVMVSRYQPTNFAWLSLADGTLGRLLDVCVAFLIGGLSLVARHHARGDANGAQQIWLRTVPVSLGLGIAGLIVGLCGHPLLRLLGQAPDLAAGAAPVMAILGIGCPAALLAISAAIYLEGISRPAPVAIAVVAANVLNLLLNGLFIGGHLGLPAMGARGSALSTTIVRFGLCAALLLIARRSRQPGILLADGAHLAEQRLSERSQWRLGFGSAGSVAVIVALTSSLTIFAGWLGVLPLATFAAAASLVGAGALVGLGMADAAGIYVAAAAGQRDDRAVVAVARSGLRITLSVVATIAVLLALLSRPVAHLYTDHADARASMAALVPFAALVLTVDSAGFVLAASLRGVKDVAWPASIEVGTMLLLVPLAATLAFKDGLGVRGLFIAMLTVGVTRVALLATRFWWRTRQALVPVPVSLGA